MACGDAKGNRMVGKGKRSGEKCYAYYLCQVTRNDSARDCGVRAYFNDGQVEGLVWGWVTALITDPEALQRGLRAYLTEETEQTEGSTPLEERLQALEARSRTNRTKSDRLLKLYLDNEVDRDLWLQNKQELEQVEATNAASPNVKHDMRLRLIPLPIVSDCLA